VGIVSQSSAGFGSAAYTQKVFTVTGTHGRWDKETRTFNRDVVNTTVITRQRTLAGAIVRHHELTFNQQSSGDIVLSEFKDFDPNNIANRVSVRTISPPVVIRENVMDIGLRWATAAQITEVYDDVSIPTTIGFAVDSRSLIVLENVTLSNGDAYTDCLKIETIRSGERLGGSFQQISWHCPNGVGLVKSIRLRNNSGNLDSRVRELDTANSTPPGVF